MNRIARATGVLLQAIIMGYLLFFAILSLLATIGGDAVFRYQGF